MPVLKMESECHRLNSGRRGRKWEEGKSTKVENNEWKMVTEVEEKEGKDEEEETMCHSGPTYPSRTLVTMATDAGLFIISNSSSANLRAAALTSRAECCPILW